VYSNGGQNVVSAINAGVGIVVENPQSADPTIIASLFGGKGVLIDNLSGTDLTFTLDLVAGPGVEIITVDEPAPTVGASPYPSGTTQQINNTGVLTVSASSGCASSGGQNPNITNTGVLSASATNGITSTGGQTPVFSQSSEFLYYSADATRNPPAGAPWGGNTYNNFVVGNATKMVSVGSTPLTGGTDCITQVLINCYEYAGAYNIPILNIRNSNGSAGTNNNQTFQFYIGTQTGAVVYATGIQLSPNDTAQIWLYGSPTSSVYAVQMIKNYVSRFGTYSGYTGANLNT
jgi:hypothetical protein